MKKITLFFSFLVFSLFISVVSYPVQWENIGPGGGGYIMACAFQPDNSDIMYIGSDVAGIHKSTDGGVTWTKKNNGIASSTVNAGAYGIENILIDHSDYNIIYTAGWDGVYKSTDAGESWGRILKKGRSFGALAIDPGDHNVIYAGVGEIDIDKSGKGEIYKSSDAGATWEKISRGFHRKAVIYGIVADPDSPLSSRTLIAGTGKGVYKSTDGGTNWNKSNSGVSVKNIKMMDSVYKDGKLTIYILSYDKKKKKLGVYRTDDLASSWSNAAGNLPNIPFSELKIHPSDPDTVYAGNYVWRGKPIGVYKTSDAGKTWTYMSEEKNMTFGWLYKWWNQEGASYLCISESNPDIIVYGETSMFKTTDGGVKWAQTYTKDLGNNRYIGGGIEPTFAYTVAFDPSDADRYYIGYEDIGIWRTDDGGSSYIYPDGVNAVAEDYDGVSSIAVDPAVTSTIYISLAPRGLATDMGYPSNEGYILKSNDYGISWSIVGRKSSGLPGGASRIAIDPSSSVSSRTIFSAVYKRGIYKSTDDGATWNSSSSGIGKKKKGVWSIAIDPSNSSTLYAGINSFHGKKGGIYKSADSGKSWKKLTSLGNSDVIDVIIDRNNSDILYACVLGEKWESGGLYKSADSGETWNIVLDKRYLFAAVVDPSDSNRIYAAASQWWSVGKDADFGIFESTDAGDNWSKIDSPPHLYISYLGINPLNPDYLYAGTHGGGLFKGLIKAGN